MTTSLVLAFSAALAWGASDFLGGITTRELSVLQVLAVSQTCGLVVITIIFFASGGRPLSGIAVLYAAMAGVAAVLALAMLYLALAIGRSAMVGPIAASGVVVPVVVGLIQGNTLRSVTTAGMALAGVGIIFASWEPPEDRKSNSMRSQPAVVALALGAALTTGAYLTLIKAASQTSSLGTIEVLKLTATGCAILVLLVVKSSTRRQFAPSIGPEPRDRAELTHDAVRWVLVAGVGVADVVAELLYATSTVNGQLSVVSMVSGLYPVFTVALFITIYKERVNAVQLIGAAGAIAGLGLIAAGAT